MSQGDSHPKSCACYNLASCGAGEAGKLFLWLPVPHPLKKILPYLQSAKLSYEVMPERYGLSIACEPGQAQELAQNVGCLLTPIELQETQALFIRGNVQPQIQDFSDVTSLQRFIKFTQSDWLVEMLAAKRFTSFFQPIVHIKDTSRIYAHEALLRGFDQQNNLIMPGPILELATEAGLLPQVDRLARLSAIAQANQHQISSHIFINFSPTALYDPVSCLRSTVDAIDAAGIAHEQVVFEVIESNHPQDLDHLKSILKYYRDAGFLIALDDLGSGYSSLNLLHQLRPDFLKLDMGLVQDVHQDPYKALITEKILEITQQLNIQTVAEGIECIEELGWLRERGATFAQGYLIAKPSAVPATVTPSLGAIATSPKSSIALKSATLKSTTKGLTEAELHSKQRESERIVAAITQRIRQSLDLNEILQTTAAEVRQLFGVDRVVLYRFDSDWSGVVVVESVAEGWLPILGLHVIDTCFQANHAYDYQKGRSKAIADIHAAGLTPCHVQLLQDLQIRANLVVPILQQEKLWGLLIAHQCSEPRNWQPAEISLFNQLASQAAIAIQQSELYQQLQQANQELQRLASSDGLTQVANRRCFDEFLAQEWQRLAREQSPLSMILCDVDCFKLYNDTYGHLAGDDALRQVAQAIAQAVKRPADLVARYGGEEFAVILPNTDAAAAAIVAAQMQANVRALQIPHASSQVAEFITLSLGVAATIPQNQFSSATLIVAADQGLYRAKAQGRNCVFQINSEEAIPTVVMEN
uniref:EAL domain-containing protein n=1 Tax=Trichocoleus desertorum TaxID=1481672 RepID=UPI0025B581FA|nr:EAL domain-containing protein [Trichocoleus desertorum]